MKINRQLNANSRQRTAYPTIIYSFYISIGFFLSQYFNIIVYKSRGADTLRTWFNIFQVSQYQPTIKTVTICILIMDILILILTNVVINKILKRNGIRILKVGFLISVILCIVSQLIYSSIIRIAYELFFSLIIFVSLLLDIEFIYSNDYRKGDKKEYWDLLRLLLPVCISFPLLITGGSLISTFYGNQNDVIRDQIYRHIALAIYFEIGTFIFILYPIIKKLIIIRRINKNN
jgi:hypothetical protein